MLDVVGYLAQIADPTLQVPSAGEMARSSRQQRQVKAATVVVQSTLEEGPMHDG